MKTGPDLPIKMAEMISGAKECLSNYAKYFKEIKAQFRLTLNRRNSQLFFVQMRLPEKRQTPAYLSGRLAPPGDALDLDLGVLGGAHGVAVDDDGRLGRHRHRQHRVLGTDRQRALRRAHLRAAKWEF